MEPSEENHEIELDNMDYEGDPEGELEDLSDYQADD